MIQLKHDTNLTGVKPEMVMAAMVVASVYDAMGYSTVVTSACDGKHGRGSLHYVGLALDFRTRHVAAGEHDKLRDMVADALGPQFDVVLEETHLHVEYQPK